MNYLKSALLLAVLLSNFQPNAQAITHLGSGGLIKVTSSIGGDGRELYSFIYCDDLNFHQKNCHHLGTKEFYNRDEVEDRIRTSRHEYRQIQTIKNSVLGLSLAAVAGGGTMMIVGGQASVAGGISFMAGSVGAQIGAYLCNKAETHCELKNKILYSALTGDNDEVTTVSPIEAKMGTLAKIINQILR